MPKSNPTPACDDILVLQEKVAALESWRTGTEPKSSTRTTVEAAGILTFLGLEQNQTFSQTYCLSWPRLPSPFPVSIPPCLNCSTVKVSTRQSF